MDPSVLQIIWISGLLRKCRFWKGSLITRWGNSLEPRVSHLVLCVCVCVCVWVCACVCVCVCVPACVCACVWSDMKSIAFIIYVFSNLWGSETSTFSTQPCSQDPHKCDHDLVLMIVFTRWLVHPTKSTCWQHLVALWGRHSASSRTASRLCV